MKKKLPQGSFLFLKRFFGSSKYVKGKYRRKALKVSKLYQKNMRKNESAVFYKIKFLVQNFKELKMIEKFFIITMNSFFISFFKPAVDKRLPMLSQT